ncbi:hypothetical protein MRB53_027302 [Persea americana]|uniref:Uncharacterized protein n=1 Tax=Persea americana TaxID=3435 RepID=A0ACC2LLS0_PERAE|nr:hypothetical protein MRB53_027302 [Persea americana]
MEPVTLSRAVPAQLDMSTYSTEPDIGAKMQAVDTSRVAPDVKFLPWSRRPPSIFSIPNFNVIRKDTFLVRAKLGHNNADLKHGKDTRSAHENRNGKHDLFKIFIGYDPHKDLAYKCLVNSRTTSSVLSLFLVLDSQATGATHPSSHLTSTTKSQEPRRAWSSRTFELASHISQARPPTAHES